MSVQGSRRSACFGQAGLKPGGQQAAEQLAQPPSQEGGGHGADTDAYGVAGAHQRIPGRQDNHDDIKGVLGAAEVPAQTVAESPDHPVGGGGNQIGLDHQGSSKSRQGNGAAQQQKTVGQTLSLKGQDVVVEKVYDPADQDAHGNLKENLPPQRAAQQALGACKDEIE